MSTYILTSMFPNGFNDEVTERLKKLIVKRTKFAFVASEFEKRHEETDHYFQLFLNMFHEKGIKFEEEYVIDGRISKEEAQKKVQEADVVWLSGGDTIAEYKYFLEYGLVQIIREHTGIVIGMSAGSINLSKTAICTVSCGHDKQEIYNALGCVNISVEPHFVADKVSKEVLELSRNYLIYGLCDGSIIVCQDGSTEFFGEIYRIEKRIVRHI